MLRLRRKGHKTGAFETNVTVEFEKSEPNVNQSLKIIYLISDSNEI